MTCCACRRDIAAPCGFSPYIRDRAPLLFREVQGFVGVIGEVGIRFHDACQRRAAQQFGMEGQYPTFGLV